MNHQPIIDFFDARADRWDEIAADNLDYVRQLLDKVHLNRGERILDLGCGTGVITGLLHDISGGEIVGVDASSKMIEAAKKKYVAVNNIRFVALPFDEIDEGRFDTIIIYNAYPHFVDVKALVDKTCSTLVPRGKLVILHSIGREKMREHHHGLSNNISRDINSPEEEYGFFQEHFALLLAEESESHYLLAMQKND